MAEQRLIDANALLEKRRSFYEPKELESIAPIASTCITTDDVYRAPTIDAVPVVHAENVTPTHYSDEFLCGNCGFCCEITEIRHDDEYDFGLGEASAHEYECKFCPDCGAKMDGGAADEHHHPQA